MSVRGNSLTTRPNARGNARGRALVQIARTIRATALRERTAPARSSNRKDLAQRCLTRRAAAWVITRVTANRATIGRYSRLIAVARKHEAREKRDNDEMNATHWHDQSSALSDSQAELPPPRCALIDREQRSQNTAHRQGSPLQKSLPPSLSSGIWVWWCDRWVSEFSMEIWVLSYGIANITCWKSLNT